jgi:Leucine-rich repeat (LRR) protein
LPNLKTLVLTANNLSELVELEGLRNLTKLTHLTLMENPVTRKEVRHLRSGNTKVHTNHRRTTATGSSGACLQSASWTTIK